MRIVRHYKQDSKVSILGSGWSGLSGGVSYPKIDIPQFSLCQGDLFEVNSTSSLSTIVGAGAAPLTENTHFVYDKRLDASVLEDTEDGFGLLSGGITDTNISGDFTTGKLLRFIDTSTGGAVNISNPNYPYSGYGGLKIYAKNLGVMSTPPRDRIYVDPIRHICSFPRPIFYCKCESLLNMTSPNISYGVTPLLSATNSPTQSCTSAKFNNGYRVYGSGSNQSVAYYPFGNNKLSSSGVISFWAGLQNSSGNYPFLNVWLSHLQTYIQLSSINNTANNYLYVDNEQISINHTVVGYNPLSHYYIVWSKDNLCGDGKSIVVYYNGNEMFSYSSTLTNFTGNFCLDLGCASSWSGPGATIIDNIKVWDHIPSISPDWEYNSGLGREDAMHYMYGSLNDYKPKLVSPGGVGFIKLSLSAEPLSINRPQGGNEFVDGEDISDFSNGIGYFGLAHKISNSDYTPLFSNIDFYYDEAWDGSGIHAIDKYDDGISGELGSGKVVRVVNDVDGTAKNIASASGLNLVPIVKDLTTNFFFPSKTEFYIDPLRGKIILPRCIFWSKMDGYENCVTTPNIVKANNTGSLALGGYSTGFTTGYFSDRCLFTRSDASGVPGLGSWGNDAYSDYVPINSNIGAKGSLSILGYLATSVGVGGFCSAAASCYMRLGLSNTYVYIDHGGNAYLYVNGVRVASTSVPTSAWLNINLLWDTSLGLIGGKAVKAIITWGTSSSVELSSTVVPTGDTQIKCYCYGSSVGSCWYFYPTNYVIAISYVYIDNIKAWDHVVSEDPVVLQGMGFCLDSLHSIYGSVNNFKPNLAGAGGMGYYRSTSAGNIIRGIL